MVVVIVVVLVWIVVEVFNKLFITFATLQDRKTERSDGIQYNNYKTNNTNNRQLQMRLHVEKWERSDFNYVGLYRTSSTLSR